MIARDQLLAAGLQPGAVAHRVRTGALCRLLPGVFSIGPQPLVPWAREVAVLLSIGDNCVISHASAAVMWGLSSPLAGEVQVTVVARHPRPRPNVQIHRVPHLDPRDVRLRYGLPVSAPARTLIDLAGLAHGADLERALAEARVAKLVTNRELAAAIRRTPYRPGTAVLNHILRSEHAAPTRSDAERRFIRLMDEAALPRPLSNVTVAAHEVDFLWPAERLVVEVDGHRFHSHRVAFERDRARDQTLVASGYRVIRVTWRQLVDDRSALVARVARALAV